MSTSNDASRRLPTRPSQENLKKQAKRRAKLEKVPLAAAQHQVARDYGCRNWPELMQLVEAMNRSSKVPLMSSAGKPNRPLQAAARGKDMDAVRRLLDAGQFTQEELDAGLAGALWYGDVPAQWPQMKAIADLLLDYGADPDGRFGNYGPIVFGTGECLVPESLQYLIDAGTDVTFGLIDTKYGKQCPMSYWLGTYARGHNDRKHRGIDILLRHNAFIPPEVTPPILAIHRGDAKALADLIDRDPSLPRRCFADMPYGNMLLRGATLLHCAVEFGELECIDVLLDRWTDANPRADIINGIGGQTPIYHAIAAHNLPALEHFVKRLGYAIEGHRIRATFKVADTVYDTPMTPIEYAEKMSGEDIPVWRRASERELELVRSTVWPGIKRKTDSEKSPRERLEEACRAGDFDAVRQLVEAGDLPPDELHFGIAGCTSTKRTDIARFLMDRGADINADIITDYGPTILGCCEGLDDEGVRFLLDLGADAILDSGRRTKYPDQSTPLRMARDTYVRGRNQAKHRILDMLIAHGAKPDNELIMLIHRGDTDALNQLLKADPSLVNKRFPGLINTTGLPLVGSTLLHIAVEHHEIECCEVLFKHRADINAMADVAEGVGGHTPVFHVARSWLGAGYPTLQYLVRKVGQLIDTSVIAAMREDDKIIKKTVLQHAGERERILLESLGWQKKS